MTAAIMAHADSSFLLSLQILFRKSLQLRQEKYQEEEEQDIDVAYKEEELVLFENLRTLGWIRKQGMLQQPLGEALRQTILQWVQITISKEFEEGNLFESVQRFQHQVLEPWLQDLVGPAALSVDGWSSRLSYSCAECFCLVRNDEIFDLVAEYPDSHPAVLE
jgi:hypothetical protein